MFSVTLYTLGGCSPSGEFPDGTSVIEFTPVKLNGDVAGKSQTVRFDDECKVTDKGRRISCTKGGRTPLAGATYVTTKKTVCDDDGKKLVDRLTCIKGCEDGRAPIYIEDPFDTEC
jgi:hypothetical protein